MPGLTLGRDIHVPLLMTTLVIIFTLRKKKAENQEIISFWGLNKGSLSTP